MRELAYQLWAFVADRKVHRVPQAARSPEWAELVNGQEFPPLDTLYDWVKRFGWNQRADRELHAIAPDLRLRTQQTVAMGTAEAAAYLRQVLGDEEVDPKIRTQAAVALLDRGGFSPVGTRGGLGEVDAPRAILAAIGDLTGLDDTALAELELKQRETTRMRKDEARMARRG
ncbi:hypothetical protein [Iamia sp.]|uniref:hypothetical protein n=1 Tax=Iamia sp. TaxID=2722710 RepID=UPI002C6F5634|nr:hypothetical protein [Iamia sp.]HXH56602.1 hypothetical protein [Iamia sp.]